MLNLLFNMLYKSISKNNHGGKNLKIFNNKLISYLSLIVGIFLIILEIFYKLNGNLGYIITTSGVLLLLFGVLINKKLREFFINFIINFF